MAIKTVPNQKIVRVNKEPCKNQIFAQINLDALERSAQALDAGAFKLWCYCAKNQNNYQFALSSKDTEKTFGIKLKQYNNAVAELIDKGYLRQTKEGSNIYDFFEAVETEGHNAVDT